MTQAAPKKTGPSTTVITGTFVRRKSKSVAFMTEDPAPPAQSSKPIRRPARVATIRRQLVTSLLQHIAGNGVARDADSDGKSTDQESNASARLMTLKEEAKALRVCTATVYAMIERGELEHLRVSNATRVVVRLPQTDAG